ncbi:hypothetical protein EJB05_51615, partial [Eragrostis curvula]
MAVKVLFMSTPKEAIRLHRLAVLNKTKTPRRFFPVQTSIKKLKTPVLKDGNRGVMNTTVKHNIAEYWIASPYWILKANKRGPKILGTPTASALGDIPEATMGAFCCVETN